MKYLPLIWMNVWRRKVRTTFTLLCVFIAFVAVRDRDDRFGRHSALASKSQDKTGWY